MKKEMGFLLILSLFLLIPANRGEAKYPENNYPQAPEFSFKDLKGKEIALSLNKGKVVFLNFWATWCPPCRAEIPDFVEVYSQYKDKGMEIIGISVDKMALKSLQPFVEKYKINYPVVLFTQKIINDYEPGNFIPTTIIIDKKGKIRDKHIGQMDKETLIKLFLQLSEEKT